MNRDASSEEKLLKLLQKKDAEALKKGRSKPSASKAQKKRGPFAVINRFFIILILASVAYTLAGYFLVEDRDLDELIAGFDFSESKLLIKNPSSQKVFSDYLNEFESRDIFGFKIAVNQPAIFQQQVPSQPQEGLPTSQLKVVGIVLDEKAQVIIVDTKTQQTHFLHEGEAINGLTIKEIKEDKVVLDQQGRTYELVP